MLSVVTAGGEGCLPQELPPCWHGGSHGPACAGAADLPRALSKERGAWVGLCLASYSFLQRAVRSVSPWARFLSVPQLPKYL